MNINVGDTLTVAVRVTEIITDRGGTVYKVTPLTKVQWNLDMKVSQADIVRVEKEAEEVGLNVPGTPIEVDRIWSEEEEDAYRQRHSQ